MRLTHRTSLLALTVALASCSLDDPTADTLFVSIEGSKYTIGRGETIQLSVTAVNPGNQPQTLSAPSDCLLFFQARDAVTGAVVHSSADNCTGTTLTEVLQPGGSKVVTFQWDGTNAAGTRLSPGTYAVRGGAALVGRSHLGAPVLIALE